MENKAASPGQENFIRDSSQVAWTHMLICNKFCQGKIGIKIFYINSVCTQLSINIHT